jgi:drug/metabolite transporter (DMT)-like permease
VQPKPSNHILIGVLLAVIATIVWSGNFVVARGVAKQIEPVSLAFYRWCTASILITPLAWRKFQADKNIIFQNKAYFFWAALTGITLFNTCVYVAGHYTSAINLALIGTTSSPIFALIMAAIFLKERISFLRLIGVIVCLSGILFLLSRGSIETLLAFRFSKGDFWVICGALSFAVYNIFVRKKPKDISGLAFLFTVFVLGTILLIPAFIIEASSTPAIAWNRDLSLTILYLGAGTSVVSFLCWNAAIARLGAARTALFGNLIPIFSVIEAVIFLNEEFTSIHIISGTLVLTGLVIANIQRNKKPKLVTE